MSKFVLTAELQLQAPKNVKQIVNQIQSQLNNININANIQNAGQAVGNLNNIQKAANQAATSGEKMGKSFRASIKRFSALAIATRAVSLFTNGLGGAIKEAIAFERELVKISQVTGKSISQLGKLTSTVSNLEAQEIKIDIVVINPNLINGSKPTKVKLKKPMAVVADVKKTGFPIYCICDLNNLNLFLNFCLLLSKCI